MAVSGLKCGFVPCPPVGPGLAMRAMAIDTPPQPVLWPVSGQWLPQSQQILISHSTVWFWGA